MELSSCIETRRSIRKFLDRSVSRDQIKKAVKLAQMAPSWKNTQTVRYIYVDDPALKQRIAEEATLGFQKNCDNISCAAGLFLIVTDLSSPKGEYWEAFDSGLAVQTLCLALHEQGLGSVIMALFDPARSAEFVNLPEGQRVSCLLAVGYPADGEHGNASRLPLNDVLSFY